MHPGGSFYSFLSYLQVTRAKGRKCYKLGCFWQSTVHTYISHEIFRGNRALARKEAICRNGCLRVTFSSMHLQQRFTAAHNISFCFYFPKTFVSLGKSQGCATHELSSYFQFGDRGKRGTALTEHPKLHELCLG